MNNLLLDFLAFSAIISGILVITSRNPVISVLFLISVFVNVAGYLVLLGVGFIGISYIVVYVGAVTVLFLFVIIMLNIELSEIHSVNREFTQNVPLGILIASIFTYELSSVLSVHTITNISNTILGIFLSSQKYLTSSLSTITVPKDSSQIFLTFTTINPDSIFANTQGANLHVQSIGSIIYTSASIWLIILSVILLLAIVAPITLSINRK